METKLISIIDLSRIKSKKKIAALEIQELIQYAKKKLESRYTLKESEEILSFLSKYENVVKKYN